MSLIKIEAIFNVTKEKVWEAITQPEIMKIWYFDMANFNLNIGNKFTFYEGEKKEYLHTGEVLKVEQNKVLQHTWLHREQSTGSSIVTWEIDEVDGKSKVTLTHEGVESFADAGPNFTVANYEMGWNALVKTNLRNYLYGIKKIVFTQEIKASANSIWNKMWDKKSYNEWTTPFCEGTYFTGNIEQGSRIHFLTPTGSGMFSDVFYMIENKMIFFKHIGNIEKFQEMPLDEETSKWSGSFESYKLEEENGITKITAEIDCVPEYIDYMNDKFPLALQELKKISEK